MTRPAEDGTSGAGRHVLTTQRLLLREWTRGDAKPFQEHCNTEEVMYWLDGIQSPEQLQDDVDYFIESQVNTGHTFWVMEKLADGAFLGFCGLINVPDEDSTVTGELEIGWRLRRDAWGNGYVAEAAVAALSFAFERNPAKRVVSRVSPGNVRSRKAMQRLGLTCRPSLSYSPEGESEHLLVYAIDKPTCLTSRASPRRGE